MNAIFKLAEDKYKVCVTIQDGTEESYKSSLEEAYKEYFSMQEVLNNNFNKDKPPVYGIKNVPQFVRIL